MIAAIAPSLTLVQTPVFTLMPLSQTPPGDRQAALAVGLRTIGRGLVELRGDAALDLTLARRPCGGRKALTSLDATLLEDLRRLVDPATRGDPEGPLLWTSKSLRNLAEGLRGLGFSLQANRKTLEGASHPDRDAQFGYINAQVSAALKAGQPAISVDTKKRSWWATSGTAGATIAQKANPNPCGSTTSWFHMWTASSSQDYWAVV